MTATPADLTIRRDPRTFSDRIAFSFTRFLRFIADTFFAKRYGHRAVVLETVAAVPGMGRSLPLAPVRPNRSAARVYLLFSAHAWNLQKVQTLSFEQ